MHLLRFLIGWAVVSIVPAIIWPDPKFGSGGTFIAINLYILAFPYGFGIVIWLPVIYCFGWLIVDGNLWLGTKIIQLVFTPNIQVSNTDQHPATQKSSLHALTNKLDQEL
jgi:hypothetical protein